MGAIEIFRRGCHVSMAGAPLCFSDKDLQATADAYRPERRSAPLVLGHPSDDAPAYGQVQRLEYRDGSLYVTPEVVSDDLVSLVRGGHFKKVSASFLSPWSADNPTPGAFYLRHVGFLGAMPPAVKGMADARFCESVQPRALALASPVDVAGCGTLCGAVAFVAPAGWGVDQERLALHRRALSFQEAHGVGYREAVLELTR